MSVPSPTPHPFRDYRFKPPTFESAQKEPKRERQLNRLGKKLRVSGNVTKRNVLTVAVLSDSACQADLIALRSFSRSLVVLRLQKMENARQLISDVVSEIYSLLEQHSHDEIVVFVSGHGRHNGPTCFDQTYLRVGSDWLDVYDIIAPIAEIEDDDCYLKFSFGFFIEPCSVPFPSPAPRRMFPGLSPFEFPNDENCFVYRFISTVGNESSLRDSSHDERIDGGHIPMCTLAKFMARWDEDVCDAFELVQQSFYWSENLLRARTLNPMSMSGNRLHFVGTGPRSAILRKKKSRPTTTLSTHCTLLLERPLMRYLKESQAEEQLDEVDTIIARIVSDLALKLSSRRFNLS